MPQCPPADIQVANSLYTLLSYRRSQPSVKPMNAINKTMVTTTTIRSSIQFLVGPRVLQSCNNCDVPVSQHTWRALTSLTLPRARLPPPCGLNSQAQERIHRKRLGKICQGVKLSKTAWTHTDGGQHDDGQLLAVAIDVLRVEPS